MRIIYDLNVCDACICKSRPNHWELSRGVEWCDCWRWLILELIGCFLCSPKYKPDKTDLESKMAFSLSTLWESARLLWAGESSRALKGYSSPQGGYVLVSQQFGTTQTQTINFFWISAWWLNILKPQGVVRNRCSLLFFCARSVFFLFWMVWGYGLPNVMGYKYMHATSQCVYIYNYTRIYIYIFIHTHIYIYM